MAPKVFEETTGMMLLSTLFTMGLWGAGTVQLYYYYDTYRSDHLLFKLYVFLIWLFDTAHQGVLFAYVYVTFVQNFGEYAILLPSKFAAWVAFCGAFVSIMVQAVFIWRIWRLSKRNNILLGLISLFAIAQFALNLTYFELNLHMSSSLSDLINVSRGVNSSTVVTDCLIAFSLVWFLQRSRTGFQRSDTVINRLIVFTISTGLATAVSAVLTLIMTFAYPDKLFYVVFFLNITRLYVNSLLAMLNYRRSLSGGFDSSNAASGGGGIPMSPFKARTGDTSYSNSFAKKQSRIGSRSFNVTIMSQTGDEDMEKANQSIVRDNSAVTENDSFIDLSTPSKPTELIGTSIAR